MKNIIMAALSILFIGANADAAGKLRIVATVPELVDITNRIGGAHVGVDGLAKGSEDIHQVTPRPSFLTKLNKADAVVYLGLSVEHAFLPGLLEVASNPNMRSEPSGCTGPACIDCSKGLYVLEKPEDLSRAQGELHPQGNPHYNVNPENGALIARNIAEGLSRLDPADAPDYDKNLKAYLAELEPKLAEWRKAVAPLKGLKAIAFHKDTAYLGQFTGIDFVDTVENKPGVAPTPKHLKELVDEMRAQKIGLLVREQQYDPKTANWIAEQTGAKVAVIATMANAMPGTETFIKFSDHNIKALVEAAGAKKTVE